MNKIESLKQIIKNSRKIVLFTGAGFSVPSGIPDFRSSTGIYSEKLHNTYNPEEIISHSFFLNHPDIFYEFYLSKMVYPNALPNKAHLYFKKLEDIGKLSCVITQNIDGLDKECGIKNVYELHGTIKHNHCLRCNKHYTDKEIIESNNYYCSCGGLIKPDVVLYEENLDLSLLYKAINEIESCDTLIVVGTSLIVNPAASLVTYFKGKNLVLINKSKTNYDHYANLVINDDIINVVEGLEEE